MTRTIGEAIEERLHEMRIQQKELAAVIDVPVHAQQLAAAGARHPCALHLKDRARPALHPDLSAVGRRGRSRATDQKRRH